MKKCIDHSHNRLTKDFQIEFSLPQRSETVQEFGTNKAVFLDRDGVLIEDLLLTDASRINLFEGVPKALRKMKEAGFFLIVVTNQTVISRGLASEEEVARLNDCIRDMITQRDGPLLDAFYVCPHHPNASMDRYRKVCDCRKPRPGMLLQAAREWGLDLSACFMVGDRVTDIIAGARGGCKTVLVRTGAHLAPPIETIEELDLSIVPDFSCDSLEDAAGWILGMSCER